MANWLCSNPPGSWFDHACTVQFHIHVSVDTPGRNRCGLHRTYVPSDTRSKYWYDCNFNSRRSGCNLQVPRVPTDRPVSSILQYFWNYNLVSPAFHEKDSYRSCKISGQYNVKISMVCFHVFDHCFLHVSCYRVGLIHRRMASSRWHWSSGKGLLSLNPLTTSSRIILAY